MKKISLLVSFIFVAILLVGGFFLLNENSPIRNNFPGRFGDDLVIVESKEYGKKLSAGVYNVSAKKMRMMREFRLDRTMSIGHHNNGFLYASFDPKTSDLFFRTDGNIISSNYENICVNNTPCYSYFVYKVNLKDSNSPQIIYKNPYTDIENHPEIPLTGFLPPDATSAPS